MKHHSFFGFAAARTPFPPPPVTQPPVTRLPITRTPVALTAAAALAAATLLGGCASPADGATTARPPEENSSPAAVIEIPEETSAPAAGPIQEDSAPDAAGQAREAEEGLDTDPVEQLLSQMSLHQKVCQLFMLRPESLERLVGLEEEDGAVQENGAAQENSDVSENGTEQGKSSENATLPAATEMTETMKEALAGCPVGGIILFGDNIVSPDQVRAFNQALQDASPIPLFIAVDEEGGRVARLANHEGFDLPRYESAAAVGSSGDPADALAMGSSIGSYLREYGFTMDFAPDADVNTNPDNPVIGNRAFSSDAETAARMAAAMAEGLRQEGILPVFKHFPGHGDTAEDSHLGIAVSHKTAEEMAACEWLPFKEATDRDGIMIGHIAAPAVTGDMTVASLSAPIVTGILREQLGFQGLIVTDSLEMGAVTEDHGSGEAAVEAVLAGCDILLMPLDPPEALKAVEEAVKKGTITEERLDESVRRILSYKIKP